jgi:hypothetical protein
LLVIVRRAPTHADASAIRRLVRRRIVRRRERVEPCHDVDVLRQRPNLQEVAEQRGVGRRRQGGIPGDAWIAGRIIQTVQIAHVGPPRRVRAASLPMEPAPAITLRGIGPMDSDFRRNGENGKACESENG